MKWNAIFMIEEASNFNIGTEHVWLYGRGIDDEECEHYQRDEPTRVVGMITFLGPRLKGEVMVQRFLNVMNNVRPIA
jgi:hypothetical protein